MQNKELERYLEDDVEDDHAKFDILNWWKLKASKYYILSCMVRDILVILVSNVSSESAFSTRGKILDSFRSSLSPTIIEALSFMPKIGLDLLGKMLMTCKLK